MNYIFSCILFSLLNIKIKSKIKNRVYFCTILTPTHNLKLFDGSVIFNFLKSFVIILMKNAFKLNVELSIPSFFFFLSRQEIKPPTIFWQM